MKKRSLYTYWGICFILCAGLGFIPNPAGLVKAVMVLLSLLFFLPGALVLYGGIRREDRAAVSRIRTLSAVSLLATLLTLVANLLVTRAPTLVGDLFYALLVIVSTPMVCGQYWIVSLFLWSCLLVASILWMPKK